MVKAKIPAVLFFLLITFGSKSESFWKIKTESGEEILLSIEVDASSRTFKACTRKEAIKEIAGFFAYNLAHAAGKLKYPEIVYIEGKANPLKDSLKLSGNFYYTDKKYDFQAGILGSNFQGKYTDAKKRVHWLNGIKQPDGRPINNYSAILNQIIALSEKYFPNPEWVKSGDWKDFKDAVSELKSKISDDYELGALVMWYARKFSYAPFDVSKVVPDEKPKEKPKCQLQIIRPRIGLITGSQLPWNNKQADSLVSIMMKQSVSKLIIDLRGRSAVDPIQVKLALNYLCHNNFSAGVWLSRKWYNLHSSFNISDVKPNLLKSFAEVSQAVKFQDVDGYVLDIFKEKQAFSGEVFVLTDSRTSKQAEVLAYVLQHEKLAKVIGQKSACQPYVVEKFHLSDDFELQIPVAVFIGSNGQNPSKSGVTPDILLEKENALTYILKNISD